MRYITAAIAVLSGLIVLLGYLYPLDMLIQLRAVLTNWAVIVAGMAVLVGVTHLVLVHMDKIRQRQVNSIYGVVLVAALFVTVLIGLLGEPLGMAGPFMRFAVDAVIVPVESSLMAILAVTLVYASIRLLRRRADVMTVIFLAVAILFLIAVMPTPVGPMPGDFLLLQFLRLFSDGGARGLLLGIALGALLTSLRVLFGIDRPYGGG